MTETFRRLWAFCRKRQTNLKAALVFSFIRSTLGITQLMAVITTVQVLTGSMEPRSGLLRVVLLTLICIVGSFAASYFEQILSIESGMYSTADQRTEAARLLRRVPLGFFRQTSSERIIASLTTTLSGMEMASSMTIVSMVSGVFNAAALFLFMPLEHYVRRRIFSGNYLCSEHSAVH